MGEGGQSTHGKGQLADAHEGISQLLTAIGCVERILDLDKPRLDEIEEDVLLKLCMLTRALQDREQLSGPRSLEQALLRLIEGEGLSGRNALPTFTGDEALVEGCAQVLPRWSSGG